MENKFSIRRLINKYGTCTVYFTNMPLCRYFNINGPVEYYYTKNGHFGDYKNKFVLLLNKNGSCAYCF